MRYARIVIVSMLIMAAIPLTYLFITRTLERVERNECARWTNQINNYPLYQSTAWQRLQCKRYGVVLTR